MVILTEDSHAANCSTVGKRGSFGPCQLVHNRFTSQIDCFVLNEIKYLIGSERRCSEKRENNFRTGRNCISSMYRFGKEKYLWERKSKSISRSRDRVYVFEPDPVTLGGDTNTITRVAILECGFIGGKRIPFVGLCVALSAKQCFRCVELDKISGFGHITSATGDLISPV